MSISAIVGTIIVAVFLGLQYVLLNEEFEITKRPWIGFTNFELIDGVVYIEYKNFGTLPNFDSKVKTLIKTEKFTKDLLNEITELEYGGILLQNQDNTIDYFIDESTLSNINNGGFFFGTEITYTFFENNIGVYGTIVEYVPQKNKFFTIENWVE